MPYPLGGVKPIMGKSTHVPAGWPTLIPRIAADDPRGLVEFIRDVFGAAAGFHPERPSVGASVVHARPQRAATSQAPAGTLPDAASQLGRLLVWRKPSANAGNNPIPRRSDLSLLRRDHLANQDDDADREVASALPTGSRQRGLHEQANLSQGCVLDALYPPLPSDDPLRLHPRTSGFRAPAPARPSRRRHPHVPASPLRTGHSDRRSARGSTLATLQLWNAQ